MLRAIVLALLLAGCAYTPLEPTDRDETTVTITWERDNTEAACYHRTGASAHGCAVWLRDQCAIYAPMPAGQDDHHALEVLGHELLHCFVGAWH